MASEGLSPRAESLLRTLVDMHIREDSPWAQKPCTWKAAWVSPATIRNVMSDLEDRGFVLASHISRKNTDGAGLPALRRQLAANESYR